jgi:hypothetical protein
MSSSTAASVLFCTVVGDELRVDGGDTESITGSACCCEYRAPRLVDVSLWRRSLEPDPHRVLEAETQAGLHGVLEAETQSGLHSRGAGGGEQENLARLQEC